VSTHFANIEDTTNHTYARRQLRAYQAGLKQLRALGLRPEHFVVQDYLGADKRYYDPTEQGVEKKIKERVEKWRAQFAM
jgi:replication-associated recombination protein RarA